MENPEMISLAEALSIAFQHAKMLNPERVNFVQSAGRILAEPVFSDVDMPPFDKSAMDGYACKKEDLGKELAVLEVIAAGKTPKFTVERGQCSKIMTGAEVPKGADAVFVVEQSQTLASNKVRFTGIKTGSNICLAGEDLKAGDLVLKAGTLLRPQHIAMLAAVGCTNPAVYRQPKIGVISTGSELVEPGQKPGAAQIRNSNGHQLVAQAAQIGCITHYYGIIADERDAIFQAIRNSSIENDLTLVSGGVSVGDFDFVPTVIEELGFDIRFSKLTVKPGKHTTFAVKENKYIIGLPGNPVSSFIQFEVFVRPFLYKLMNFEGEKRPLPFPLAADFKRRNADREEFVPVKINNKHKAETIPYHGSAHIHAYHEAFGFMIVPVGVERMSLGEVVYVQPL